MENKEMSLRTVMVLWSYINPVCVCVYVRAM